MYQRYFLCQSNQPLLLSATPPVRLPQYFILLLTYLMPFIIILIRMIRNQIFLWILKATNSVFSRHLETAHSAVIREMFLSFRRVGYLCASFGIIFFFRNIKQPLYFTSDSFHTILWVKYKVTEVGLILVICNKRFGLVMCLHFLSGQWKIKCLQMVSHHQYLRHIF